MEEWIQSVFWYSKVHFGIYYTQNCRSSEGRYLNRKYSSIISVGQLVSVFGVFYFTLLNFIEPFVLFYCVLRLLFLCTLFLSWEFFHFIELHYLFQYFVMIHVIELDFYNTQPLCFTLFYCDFLLYCWYWIFRIYGFLSKKQPINIRG